MSERPTGQKRPRDVIGTANEVAKIATGEVEDETMAGKEYAQKGGLKGGAVRAQRLTTTQRKLIAQRAAHVRCERWPNYFEQLAGCR